MKIRLKLDFEMSTTMGGTQAAEYRRLLLSLAGKTLEVDTEYLFKDQFNTKPTYKESRWGLRVMAHNVAEVIDDERPDAGCCEHCGRTLLKAKSRGLIGSLCGDCGGQYGEFLKTSKRVGDGRERMIRHRSIHVSSPSE